MRANSPLLQHKKVRSTSPRLTASSVSNPSVLHVYPASARQNVLYEQQQQKQQRQASRTRSGSPAAKDNNRRGNTALAALRSGSNNNNRNNNNKKQDPRSRAITPFRDISHQPTSTSLDGRLLYLLKDYSTTVMPAQDQKVQNIASRLRRSKILAQPELTALETCFQRNANFMLTIERILGEAVEKQIDMRRNVIHQSYEIWRACNDANSFIGMLLDTAQSAIGVGKYSSGNLKNYGQHQQQQQQNQTAAGSLSRSGTPLLRSSSGATANNHHHHHHQRSITPTAFAQVHKPNAPPRQQLEPVTVLPHQGARMASSSPLRSVPQVGPALGPAPGQQGYHDFSQGSTVPPNMFNNNSNNNPNFLPSGGGELAQYQQQGAARLRSASRPQGPVGVEDAREAQEMFERLFGPEEGRTRFLHWLSEMPQSTIHQLHRHLMTSGSNSARSGSGAGGAGNRNQQHQQQQQQQLQLPANNNYVAKENFQPPYTQQQQGVVPSAAAASGGGGHHTSSSIPSSYSSPPSHHHHQQQAPPNMATFQQQPM